MDNFSVIPMETEARLNRRLMLLVPIVHIFHFTITMKLACFFPNQTPFVQMNFRYSNLVAKTWMDTKTSTLTCCVSLPEK